MAEGRVLSEPEVVVRLWLHECTRVFQDRLVNDEDRAWFENQLREELEAHLEASWDDIVDESQVDVNGKTRLMFCDFLVPGAEPRVYDEVTDIVGVIPTVEEYLADYNSESKVSGRLSRSLFCSRFDMLFRCIQTPMRLVMFLDAVEHVSRISRVLRQVRLSVS